MQIFVLVRKDALHIAVELTAEKTIKIRKLQCQ